MDAPTRNVQHLTGGEHEDEGTTDVSQLRFEEGLVKVDLTFNQIVEMWNRLVWPGLSLPEGLELN